MQGPGISDVHHLLQQSESNPPSAAVAFERRRLCIQANDAADVGLLVAIDETHVVADLEVGARAGVEFLCALVRLEYFNFDHARLFPEIDSRIRHAAPACPLIRVVERHVAAVQGDDATDPARLPPFTAPGLPHL